MKFFLKLLISSLAVFFSAFLLPGVKVDKFTTAIIVAVFLSILNSLLKPTLIFLTIPFTIFTFGFFLLVINAFIILIADYFVPGFDVDGFWWALLFSIILSLTTYFLEKLTKKEEREYTN